MEIFFGVMILVMGLCVGSFVNMLLYRTAVRYKLKVKSSKFKVKNKSRSFCDYCGRQLRWYENVPVISWVIQKGKTRCCHKKLPISYPLLEVGMGVIFLIFLQITNYPPMADFTSFYKLQITNVLGLVIITLLVFSAVFDAKYMILPDFSTYILIGIAFLGVVFDEKNMIPYLLSAVAGAGFLGILYLLTKGKGMGFGDVKLAIFMGLFLGWPKIVVAFYVAFITGAVVGIVLMAVGKIKKGKTMIPFGPFLILGVMVAWWWGENILSIIFNF